MTQTPDPSIEKTSRQAIAGQVQSVMCVRFEAGRQSRDRLRCLPCRLSLYNASDAMFYAAIADRSQSASGFRFYAGRLVLGTDLEFLRCAAGRWTPGHYRTQWRLASAQLTFHPRATSAFVTSVARGVGNLEWWLARRSGNTVTFTNQLLFLRKPKLRVKPERAHEFRHQPSFRRNLAEPAPSEWRLPYSSVRRYLRAAPNPSIERMFG
jgi:hypothetical protein